MTPRLAADEIADRVWQWSKDAGSPMVLTHEDREEIAAIVRKLTEEPCSWCMNGAAL